MSVSMILFLMMTPFILGILCLVGLYLSSGDRGGSGLRRTSDATRRGGDGYPLDLTRSPITLSIDGRAARIEAGSISRLRRGWIGIFVDVRGISPGVLRIVPQGASGAFLKLLGSQDLEVGDLNFDVLYRVQAEPPGLVREVFSAERRAPAVASVRSLEGHGEPRIELGRERVAIRVGGARAGTALLRDLVEAATEWLQFIKVSFPVVDVVWMEDPTGALGQCQVCGTGMRERVVLCRKCRTPHHRECWEYTGLCSTFGCGETRHGSEREEVPVPAPGPPPWAVSASRERRARRARLGPYGEFRSGPP